MPVQSVNALQLQSHPALQTEQPAHNFKAHFAHKILPTSAPVL